MYICISWWSPPCLCSRFDEMDVCIFSFFLLLYILKTNIFFLDFFLHKAYVYMLVYVVCAFKKLHKSKRCSPQLDEELYNCKRIYNAQKYQLFYDAFFLILFCYFFKHFLYALSCLLTEKPSYFERMFFVWLIFFPFRLSQKSVFEQISLLFCTLCFSLHSDHVCV